MKKFIITLLLAIIALTPFTMNAEENSDTVKDTSTRANVYLFRGEGCPHCEEALAYLNSIKDEENINLVTFEVWYNSNNSAIMNDVAALLNKTVDGVPFIVIGKTTFSGYAEDYNADILKAVKAEIKNNNANDVVSSFSGLEADDGTISSGEEKEEKKNNGSILLFILIIIGGIGALIFFGKKSIKEA